MQTKGQRIASKRQSKRLRLDILMSMKILATSDWHLGNLFHGNDRLPEHKHFLKWLLEQIAEQKPDALLIAGDIFDNGNPSAAAQTVYYEFLADATQLCPNMQVIITAGNHDSASRLEAPRPLLTRYHVEIRGNVRKIWQQGESEDDVKTGGHWIYSFDDLIIPITNEEGEEVIILAVPYLRSDVVQNASYSQGVNDFLRELTAEARKKYPGRKCIMMAHMYAKGSDIAKKDASEKIIIGGQEEVDLEGWNDHPDYMTCGHIHKRQHIWNTDWARYTGSILPMSFAEKDYTHGIDLITIEHGEEEVDLEGWNDHPDYMTCGHIHKRQHIWNTDWARYTGSILPMSFAEKDYTHGIDLITIEHGEEDEGKETGKSKEWKVDFLEYKPQHALRILPEDEEELTFKKWQKLINSELSERTDGELSDHFDYVMLKVKQEKLSSDDIKELEKLVNEKDAVLCKIQRIIPQLDLSTIQGSQHITSIEDIINRPPLDTLKEAFAIRHNAPMNERQEKMLSDLLTTSSL